MVAHAGAAEEPADASEAATGPAGLATRAQPQPAEAIERLLQEADAAYRARRWSAAMDAYRGVVAADPENPGAWLRIGNLHHRRSQWLSAASAYRRAADRAEGVPEEAALRLKALLNLASVNLELAADALAQAEAVPSAGPDTEGVRREVREQWQSMLRRAGDGRRRVDAAPSVPAPASASSRAPAPASVSSLAAPPLSARKPAVAPSAPPGRDGGRGPLIEYQSGAPGP